MLRSLLDIGRSSCLLTQQGHAVRWMAAQPKQSLEQYVAGIREQIAESYNQRVTKYDNYVTAFETFVSSTGLPRANDFKGAKAFAAKRAEMLKQVGFPDDWKVKGAEADKIRDLLKEVPAARKAGDGSSSPPWYHSLTDAQLSECEKDPQLFVELSKLHAFEDQYNMASQSSATKYGLPPIDIGELPAKLEPIGDHTISAKEAQWILQKAREHAETLRKTDPRFSDPFSTPEFEKVQQRTADRLGMNADQLKAAQTEMSPEKWKQVSADNGLAL